MISRLSDWSAQAHPASLMCYLQCYVVPRLRVCSCVSASHDGINFHVIATSTPTCQFVTVTHTSMSTQIDTCVVLTLLGIFAPPSPKIGFESWFFKTSGISEVWVWSEMVLHTRYSNSSTPILRPGSGCVSGNTPQRYLYADILYDTRWGG